MDLAILSDTDDTGSLLRTVLETVQDGVAVFDGGGAIRSLNAAARRMFGYAPDPAVGLNVGQLLPGLAEGDLGTLLATHYAGRVSEMVAKRRDGGALVVEFTLSELKGQKERLFVGAMHDLSEQRAAEKHRAEVERARAATEAFYGALTEGVTDYAITILDPAGKIASWNEGARKLKGYEADEIVGRHFSIFYTPEDIAAGIPELALARARDAGKVEEESLRVRKDGSCFWASQVIGPVRGEDGMLLGYVKVTRDITERKEAERRMREEGARLLAITNTVLDGLITIDARGTIQSFNPAAVGIFGYSPAEVLGRNVNMLMPEPYHHEHDGYLKHYMDGGEARVIGIGREVSGRRKDGSVFPLELGINEMRVNGERLFVGTVRDISARKASEAAIHNYIERLTRSNQELDDFAYIASHDLKEPIRGLSNNARFLMEDCAEMVDDGGRKRLNRMAYLCQRMESLVDDLLYFSRLGRQELAVQAADLNVVVRDIEVLMEASLMEQHAEIVIPKPLPSITCDMPRVTEVFRNLITNAVKYNDKAKKRVEIGVAGSDDKSGAPIFYVRDNGIGIEARFFNDIFRIFKRLNEEDDSVKGTGVGLTFVKKIVERHGGRIWLESEPGAGTTFYFTLKTPA